MDGTVTDRFEASRGRLVSLAYRLLGSGTDAEDAVQDAFLRWQAADRELIEVPEAWLTRIVTHLCLDRLRSAQARRERAVGAWLPEPLLSGDPMLDPAETVEQRESVSLAVLLLMERLAPVERAVYVLREAFSHSHAEIAALLDITESGSQQHLHRARRRVAAARPGGGTVDPASARRVVEEFLAAAMSGRTERLVALLTDDATAVGEAAGLTSTMLRYETAERIAVVARGGFRPTPAKRRLLGGTPAIHFELLNGSPALLIVLDDQVAGAVAFDVRDGRVAALRGFSAPRLGPVIRAWRRREPGAPLIAEW